MNQKLEAWKQFAERHKDEPGFDSVLSIAAVGLTVAINALEATRWNPTGDLQEWRETPEGQNHRAVTDALETLNEVLAFMRQKGQDAMSHEVKIKGEYTTDDGYEKTIPIPNGWDDLQTGTCPDCGGTWHWAEAGYVPGTRECSCGSMFSAQPMGQTGRIRRERFYRR